MNKATLYGRLGHTPELKSLPNGTKVATMTLATSHVYYDQNKQKIEQTDWHNLVCFGKMAENLAQYCEGGQQMLMTGRIVTRSWDDEKLGIKKYRTEIIVDGFEFGARSAAREEKRGTSATNPTKTPEVKGEGYKGPELASIDYGDADINIDDIPF